MRSIFREFWILLILCYVVLGISVMRATERPLDRAAHLVSEGRAGEALPILRAELAKTPPPGDDQLVMSVVYLEKGENDRALAAMRKSLAFKKKSS